MSRRARRGFAMIVVLWVIAGLSLIGVAALTLAHDLIGASRNRAEIERIMWVAEGCAAALLSGVDDVAYPSREVDRQAWNRLPEGLQAVVSTLRCTVTVEALGTSINVNSASAEMLTALMHAHGLGHARADSAADAILDWIDQDDLSLHDGAERSWYVQRGLPAPRNGLIAAQSELHLVRGIEDDTALVQYLGVDERPVVLSRAPAPVLAALPGMSPQAVESILRQRQEHGEVDLLRLVDALSGWPRDSLASRFAELGRMTSSSPEIWRLTVRATSPRGLTLVLTCDVAPAEDRPAVLRRSIVLR